MEQSTKENGMKILIKEMVKASKCGLMAPFMKAIGETIRPMAEEG